MDEAHVCFANYFLKLSVWLPSRRLVKTKRMSAWFGNKVKRKGG